MTRTKTALVACAALALSFGAAVLPASAQPMMHRHHGMMMHHDRMMMRHHGMMMRHDRMMMRHHMMHRGMMHRRMM